MPGLFDKLLREVELLCSREADRAVTLRLFLTAAGFDVPAKLDEMIRTKGVAGLDDAPAR